MPMPSIIRAEAVTTAPPPALFLTATDIPTHPSLLFEVYELLLVAPAGVMTSELPIANSPPVVVAADWTLLFAYAQALIGLVELAAPSWPAKGTCIALSV